MELQFTWAHAFQLIQTLTFWLTCEQLLGGWGGGSAREIKKKQPQDSYGGVTSSAKTFTDCCTSLSLGTNSQVNLCFSAFCYWVTCWPKFTLKVMWHNQVHRLIWHCELLAWSRNHVTKRVFQHFVHANRYKTTLCLLLDCAVSKKFVRRGHTLRNLLFCMQTRRMVALLVYTNSSCDFCFWHWNFGYGYAWWRSD